MIVREVFAPIDGNSGFTITDDRIMVGYQSIYYSDINNIFIGYHASNGRNGTIGLTTNDGKTQYLSYSYDDSVRAVEGINYVRKKIGYNPLPVPHIPEAIEKSNESKSSTNKSSEVKTSKGDSVLGTGCIVVVLIIMIIAVVFLFKGCAYILSDQDADNDGLTDSFEDEIGTDPNGYTWNWEWND